MSEKKCFTVWLAHLRGEYNPPNRLIRSKFFVFNVPQRFCLSCYCENNARHSWTQISGRVSVHSTVILQRTCCEKDTCKIVRYWLYSDLHSKSGQAARDVTNLLTKRKETQGQEEGACEHVRPTGCSIAALELGEVRSTRGPTYHLGTYQTRLCS